MSLVILKYEPGGKTTQPRLYKRGNDDIDLDAYIRDAESEFSYWLANSRLKDKEKQLVQEAYSQMLQGISDGTFTYNIGGGYSNSIGMSNKKKGFDAAGLAAGFLGNILRNQNVYTPEEKSDSSKTKYEGSKTIGSRALKHLLGDAGNILYFINLDPLVDGKRGHTNRMKLVLEYLNDIATEGNWDKYFTGYSPEQKDEWFKNYEKYGKNIDVNGNGIFDEDEYLGLSKLLGLDNLEKLFFTGQTYGSQPASKTESLSTSDVTSYNNEDEWRTAVHPKSTVIDFTNRTLTTNAVYKREGRIKLNSILMGMSKDNLLKLVQTGLKYSPSGQELNKGRSILQGFGLLTSFENNFIVRLALEVMKRKNYLHQFPTDQNSYYIPFVSSKLDSRGTGFVYTISPDGNHALREMDRWDIPFYTDKWHNEFIGQVPSNKQGGILRKFSTGGSPSPWYSGMIDYDPTKYKYGYNLELLVNGDMSDDNFDPWASPTASKSLGRYLPTSGYGNYGINQKHFNYAKGIEEQNYYQDFGKALLDEYGKPTEVGIAWMHAVDAYLPKESPARFFDKDGNLRTFWTSTGKDVHGRAQKTYNSLSDYINYIRNDQILGARHNVFLNEGKRYFYTDSNGVRHWVDPELISKYKVSENPVRSTWNDDNTIYWNDYELTGLKAPAEPQKEEPTPESFLLGEKYLPTTPSTGSFGNFTTELTPDLISAGRLWASLHTNNKVYDTVLPSLRPVLKDTYEKYSPVTGAFSAMLLKNRLGADVLSQSYKPFTSDASLAAARMLEGLRQANQLQADGFLADDLEIRRTQREALARLEDNRARRSDVANFNRASINLTDRERAQLKATHLKSNWQSWDNFLQGIESRIRVRNDENKVRVNNFYDKLINLQSSKWYNELMKPANEELQAWIESDEGKAANGDYTKWSKWKHYLKRQQLATEMAQAMIDSDVSKRYSIHGYLNPFTSESYNNFIKW